MKKKTTKPNPLKVFNDNNAKAIMRAGGVMKSYKKTLKKAQMGDPGTQFENRRDALNRLSGIENAIGSRDEILKDINKRSSKDYITEEKRNKAFYDSLDPVEPGRVRAPYKPLSTEDPALTFSKRALAQRDAAEKYVRDYDTKNPIGSLSTKKVTPIQKKGGAVKRKKK
jgi:hypothetical protein